MSLAKFPVFSILNTLLVLFAATVLVLMFTLWHGFLKECPATRHFILVFQLVLGYLICLGLLGLLSTITRSRLMIYTYKCALFVAFILSIIFLIGLFLAHGKAFNGILELAWIAVPDSDKCSFQNSFSCAGWALSCYQNVTGVRGCPSCTRFPSVEEINHKEALSTKVMQIAKLSPAYPTCLSVFHDVIVKYYTNILISTGCFIVYIIILNIAAYCAGQRFSIISIEDDELYLAQLEVNRYRNRRRRYQLHKEITDDVLPLNTSYVSRR
eukprot:Tbor_TRINITY_DN5515_c2_g1::TRINITY_DN5515_c2_g1_i2::g.13412::m.13412